MHTRHFRWMSWAEVRGINFGRFLATSAATCPHMGKKKMRLFYFIGNAAQDCGLCVGNAHQAKKMLLVPNGVLGACGANELMGIHLIPRFYVQD